MVCHISVETIVQADEEYQELKKRGINYRMDINSANLLAIYSKIVDIFTITKIAFENNVPWIPNYSANNPEEIK